MNIDLDRDEIITEISENYPDESDFLFSIVSETTSKWETVSELTEMLLNYLNDNSEIFRVEERIKELNKTL